MIQTRALEILKAQTLLYAEDEKATRNMFADYFQKIFREVWCASHGVEALELALQKSPALIVADINMPFLSGIDLVKKLRQKGSEARVIITTAHAEQHYLLDAVELDITRYLLKPIFKQDLDGALEKAAQEIVQRVGECICLGGQWSYDPASQILQCEGSSLTITPLERSFLHLIITNRHRIVRYEEIASRVWGEREMTNDALKSLVRELRRKLGKECLKNISGTGYQFHLPSE